MKLADAILLQSTLQQVNSANWRTCLIGMAVSALGGDNRMNREAVERWPWIKEKKVIPPLFYPAERRYRTLLPEDGECSFLVVISELAYQVEKERIPLEQVVDWVRSVEPDEAPAVEVNVDYGQLVGETRG